MTNIKFAVMSRAKIESKAYQDEIKSPHIVISINDDVPAFLYDNGTRVSSMILKFNDIDSETEQYSEVLGRIKYIAFNENMALQILDFVDNWIGTELSVVVHCLAGRCRSVAVASALSKILNNEDDEIFKSGIPNMLVYKTLLETYFLTDNYHLRWKHIWNVRRENLPRKYDEAYEMEEEC